jgi:hypothetical protein
MTLVIALTLSTMSLALATSDIIYDTIPDPLPPNMVSIGFQANHVAEIGKRISFDEGGRLLDRVEVTLLSYACEEGSIVTGDCTSTEGASYEQEMILTLYKVGPDGAVGDIVARVVQPMVVPFRPSADDDCSGQGWMYDYEGRRCTYAYTFNVAFDLTGMPDSMPDEIIYGVAYNTSMHGYEPIGEAGPYDHLHVGVVTSADEDGLYRTAGDPLVFGPSATYATSWDPAVRFTARTATAAPTADDCKDGGHTALGFTNQGRCVASFQANEVAGR